MRMNIRRVVTSVLLSAVCVGGVGLAAAGTAAAETPVPTSTCFGLSPNIIDQPFNVSQVYTYQPAPGKIDVLVRGASSPFALVNRVGYRSTGKLVWRNLNTGRTGTAVNTATIALSSGGPSFNNLTTGRGKVRFTLSVVNRNSVLVIPTSSCGGTVTVR